MPDFEVGFRETMPVQEDVCAGESGPTAADAVPLFKIAFQFEVEILQKIAADVNARSAQKEPAVDRRDRCAVGKNAEHAARVPELSVGLDKTAEP